MLRRIHEVYRSQGASRLVWFLITRVVRTSSHVVYGTDLHDSATFNTSIMEEVLVVDEESLVQIDPTLRQSLDHSAPEYMADVESGRAVAIVIMRGHTAAHHAFMMMESKTLCLLGVERPAVLLGNAYTMPAYRGQGLQQLSLVHRLLEAAKRKYRRAVAETSPDNRPSRRAMEKVGMKPFMEVRVVIILNRLVIRFGKRKSRFLSVGWCS